VGSPCPYLPAGGCFECPPCLVCFVVSIGVRFLNLKAPKHKVPPQTPTRTALALVLLRCISSAVCALRTRWPQRALRPLLWDRPRRAARRALRLRQLLLLHRALGQSARLPLLSTWLRHGRHLLHVPSRLRALLGHWSPRAAARLLLGQSHLQRACTLRL